MPPTTTQSKMEGGPLKPLNPWMAFQSEQRAIVAKANPGMTVQEVVAHLGTIWRGLSDEQKAPYMQQAKADKERYDNEKANWMTKPPKRPMNPYLFFAQEQRPIVVKANPGLPTKDVPVELAKLWRGMSEEQKEPYNIRANLDKQRYEADYARYQGQQRQCSKRRGKKGAAKKKEKASKDVPTFLAKLRLKERCWPMLESQAITDLHTLANLSQEDLRSIGMLLGDASKIARAFEEMQGELQQNKQQQHH